MKISKSFKIYIHIFVILFFAQQLLSAKNYSKNIVAYVAAKSGILGLTRALAVDLTGKKGNIMIINFWATWCVPCKKEMPSLENCLSYIQK